MLLFAATRTVTTFPHPLFSRSTASTDGTLLQISKEARGENPRRIKTREQSGVEPTGEESSDELVHRARHTKNRAQREDLMIVDLIILQHVTLFCSSHSLAKALFRETTQRWSRTAGHHGAPILLFRQLWNSMRTPAACAFP